MNIKEYMTYDATGLASLVQKKQVTPEELVQAAFTRLEEVNPVLNAVIQTRRDQVFKDMKSLDADQPFAGVPFVLKNISQGLEHEPLTAGALLLKDVKAQTDSHFVRRLKQAGLLMIGHTNTPEFGLRNVTEPFYMVRRETLGMLTILRAVQAAGRQQLWQAASYRRVERVMAEGLFGFRHPLLVYLDSSQQGENTGRPGCRKAVARSFH